ncbi:MAG TPA: VCBS repeat-containing protein [Ktedonosporobacter sp.]|nr:VCBS repeat-containing protein [Ktedonosporobacter sp.]
MQPPRLKIAVLLLVIAAVFVFLLNLGVLAQAHSGAQHTHHPGASASTSQHATRTTSLQFAPAVDYPVDGEPYGLVTADFNGDGHPDLATANLSRNTVTILLNKGDGTFAPGVHYPVGKSPVDLVVGDFNRDGKPDLAVSNLLGNSITVLLNKGDGTFAPGITYPVGSKPENMAAGDLNGNGYPDLVVPNLTSNSVTVLLNKGDGTFAPGVTYPVGSGPYAVAIGDLNGDGKADLAVANYNDSTVTVLFNKGDGTFTAPGVTYPLPDTTTGPIPVHQGPQGIVIGDLNGDGHADIATSNQLGSSVTILLNKGNGTFAPSVNYPTGGAPQGIIIGDLNRDGKPDLIVANRDSNTASVLLNKGNGTFAPWVAYPVGQGPNDVAMADFDGDGCNDLATANTYASTVSVLLCRQATPTPTPTDTPTPTIGPQRYVTFWTQKLDSCRQTLPGADFTLSGNGLVITEGPTPGDKPVTVRYGGSCPIPRGNCLTIATGCLAWQIPIPAVGMASYTITEIQAPAGYVPCLGGNRCPGGPDVISLSIDAAGRIMAHTRVSLSDGRARIYPTLGFFNGTQADPALAYDNRIGKNQRWHAQNELLVTQALMHAALAAIGQE